jgi:hypothetical protein
VKDGHHTEGDETAQPAEKVVRLPRDWLGPREHLVPFGSGAAAPETPPSAADFWGERSAAIHGALQAPAEDKAELRAGASDGLAAPRPRRAIAGFGARRVAAVTGLAAAIAAVAVLATGVLGSSGSAPRTAGTARLNVAAVLSNGVSRTLQRGLALLDASAGRSRRSPTTRHRASTVRRTPRSRPVFKRVHETAHSHPIATASSASPAVARSSPPIGAHTYTPTTRSDSSPTVHPARSSAATVSPTGESGALGPIASPNG